MILEKTEYERERERERERESVCVCVDRVCQTHEKRETRNKQNAYFKQPKLTVAAVVMKNCEPFVFGPMFAIETV